MKLNETPRKTHKLVFVLDLHSNHPDKAGGVDIYFSSMGFDIQDLPDKIIYSKTVEMTEEETILIQEFRDKLTALFNE